MLSKSLAGTAGGVSPTVEHSMAQVGGYVNTKKNPGAFAPGLGCSEWASGYSVASTSRRGGLASAPLRGSLESRSEKHSGPISPF
jgi:hypothetical protein